MIEVTAKMRWWLDEKRSHFKFVIVSYAISTHLAGENASWKLTKSFKSGAEPRIMRFSHSVG